MGATHQEAPRIPNVIIGRVGTTHENLTNVSPVVAIDGPVASGKSTVGRVAAEQLGLRFLDTGIMYRAVTWLALHQHENVDDAEAMERLAKCCDISLDCERSGALLVVNHQLLMSDDLASADVDRSVSAVAANSAVRRALVAQQRSLAAAGGIVMAGRDIGSVVVPDADVKMYIDASPEVRARRRFLQQLESGISANYKQVLADTLRRDRLDSERADSPLIVPDGAIVINTERMNLSESVAAVVSAIRTVTGAASACAESGG